MEEVVRLVERGAKEAEIPYTPASPVTAAAPAPPKPTRRPSPPPPLTIAEAPTPLDEAITPIPLQIFHEQIPPEAMQPEPVVEVDEDAAR